MTNERREAVVNRVANDIYDAVAGINDRVAYEVKMEYCREVADDCITYKAGLIEMLSKHPNWDEENLRVVFEADYERPMNSSLASDKLYYLTRTILDTTNFTSSDSPHHSLGVLARELWYCRGTFSANSTVTEHMERRMKEILPDARIHTGAKTTRAVMKLLRQYGYDSLDKVEHEFLIKACNRYYTEYADAMNPMKVTKYTVLSVNPVDFLLMSYGESWHSCHNIGYNGTDIGCYSGGTLSYAYDKQTMIMYTVRAEVTRDFEGNGYYPADYSDKAKALTFAPKSTREVMFWNGSVLFPSRCYPATDDTTDVVYKEHREIAESVISTCLGIGNLWKRVGQSCYEEDNHKKINFLSYGYHYPDYSYHTYPAFAPSTLDKAEEELDYHFIIGSSAPICVCTGDAVADADCVVNVGGTGFYCALCGEWVSGDEDNYTYIDGVGTVCDECRDANFTYCDSCNCYVSDEDTEYVEGYGYVCKECLENNEDRFYYCEECQRYFYEYRYTPTYIEPYGTTLCPHCAEQFAETCANCGEAHYTEDMHEVVNNETGEIYWLCDDCYEEPTEESEDVLEEILSTELEEAEAAVRDLILGA